MAIARCHGTTKPPPPQARLHRKHNDAATHETRKDVGGISMLHQRKEHNGDKTHITRKDKEGKERATQVCYHVVPRRAHKRSNERPARATNRDQRKCGTNRGARRGKGKTAPTDARLFCIGSTTAPRHTTNEGGWVREERYKHTMVWHEGGGACAHTYAQVQRQVFFTPRRRNERGANDARRRPTYPHSSFCLTGRNGIESQRRERQRHTPGRRQGKSACQGEG